MHSLYLYLSIPGFCKYSFANKHLSQLHISNSFTNRKDLINVNITHTQHF